MNRDGGLLKKASDCVFIKSQRQRPIRRGAVTIANNGWRWGEPEYLPTMELPDVYTEFIKNGMVKLRRVDPETGSFQPGTVLPSLSPKKIEIRNGEAYFLINRMGSRTSGNWLKMVNV